MRTTPSWRHRSAGQKSCFWGVYELFPAWLPAEWDGAQNVEHNLAWKTHLHVAEEKAPVGFNTAWRLSLCPSGLLGHEKAGGCGIQMGKVTPSSSHGLQRRPRDRTLGEWCRSSYRHNVPCFIGPESSGLGSKKALFPLWLHPLLPFDLKTGPPVIHSGIKDLKVLKTTQSGFEGFLKDQFTTLPEVKDRCFATQVYCKWRYHQGRDVDFEATWYEEVLGSGTGAGSVHPLFQGPRSLQSERETWKPFSSTCPL